MSERGDNHRHGKKRKHKSKERDNKYSSNDRHPKKNKKHKHEKHGRDKDRNESSAYDRYAEADVDYRGRSKSPPRYTTGKDTDDYRDYRDHYREKEGRYYKDPSDDPSRRSEAEGSARSKHEGRPRTSRHDNDDEDIPDYAYDWAAHKYVLKKMFFTEDDPINGTAVEDFWSFLEKYKAFHQKKALQDIGSSSNKAGTGKLSDKFSLPKDYDKRYRINIALAPRETKYIPQPDERKQLTKERIQQFKKILIHYIDFQQKQKLSKLQKIRKDQQQLPIYQYKNEILEAVASHQVMLIAGDTGCGKSTQVPQYLLEGDYNCIACTQPRRIACVSLCKRIAYETLNEYGTLVGYQIRFERTRTAATKIVFLTEGLLLRQMNTDADLSQYSIIVIDEVHERHIYTDFLLGVVKCLTHAREDIKVILMSATINITLFSSYFDDAPVIQVPGRLYPIQLNYVPLSPEEVTSKSERLNPRPYIRILQMINKKTSLYQFNLPCNGEASFAPELQLQLAMKMVGQLRPTNEGNLGIPFNILHVCNHCLSCACELGNLAVVMYPDTERGDVLMFLSGMTEIMTVVEAAREYAKVTSKWIILPLHSALSIEEQDKVFDITPDGVRKCIVSTNIAETSVTIDGVRFVVDSGKVKEMNFDAKCKMQRLQEFWISRASAEQRKGRAGRTGPGVCYRLYAEADYDALQDYSTPEIQRVPLDTLVLQLISMGLPDARKFPFIEPPTATSIETTIAYLKELGALTSDEQMTPTGEMLSQLPVDVSIGKMLIMGAMFHMVEPVLSIAAALSVQSPYTNRAHADYDAVQKRKDLESNHGDPFSLLNAFDEWIEVKARGENSKKWCQRRGLQEQRFYEITKLKEQFKQLLNDHGMIDTGPATDRYLTSTERRLHHANRKQLRELRRDHRMKKVQRKVLKLEDDTEVVFEGQDEAEEEMDMETKIKDLEFRLTHNLDTMQQEQERSKQLRRRDINLLKVILCSGLYPNLAISDEQNSYKSNAEQAFHTRGKPYVLLHPTSVFASDIEALELDEKDIHKTPSQRDRRYPFSHKHQILAYVSLLETTKPYLTGTMRVPALQTIMLYSTSIDTNADCTRFVCDGWIELQLLEAEDGEKMLSAVVMLRSTWLSLTKAKLQAHKEAEQANGEFSRKAVKLERLLAKKLEEYLDSQVVYSIKRLLAADLKNLYIGPTEDAEENSKSFLGDMCKDQKPHPTKGGIQVSDYLTFSCLTNDDSAYGSYSMYMQKHWTCPRCGVTLVATVMDRLTHEQSCIADIANPMTDGTGLEMPSTSSDDKDSLRNAYHCDVCNRDLKLTTTEVLKHKRSCKAQSSSS